MSILSLTLSLVVLLDITYIKTVAITYIALRTRIVFMAAPVCRYACKCVSSVRSAIHIRGFHTGWKRMTCDFADCAHAGDTDIAGRTDRGDNKLHGPPRNGPNVKSGCRYNACDG